MVALEWGPLACFRPYIVSIANSLRVADRMADVLIELNSVGLSLANVHLVGISLGAQMCGLIGDRVQKKSKNSLIVDRITVLDPAGPLLYKMLPVGLRPLQEVSAKDASFVDVIHTDAGICGVAGSCGTVDFWPDSGTRIAPGCPIISGKCERIIFKNIIILTCWPQCRLMQSLPSLADMGGKSVAGCRSRGFFIGEMRRLGLVCSWCDYWKSHNFNGHQLSARVC